MPSNEQKQAMQSRLRAVFEVIIEEALENPAFFAKLEAVLVSRDVKYSQVRKATKASRKIDINLIEIFHERGEAGVRASLADLTNAELMQIASQEGIKKSKETKELDREQLMYLLIETTADRLKQGESFTK